jgi:hypothetical protein
MASLIKTLSLIIKYFWVTSKIQIVVLCAACFTYILDYDSFYKIVLSINSFILSIIIALSISKKDEYLRLNGFYKLLSVSNTNILISKSIILFCLFSIHLALFLFIALKLSIGIYFVVTLFVLLVIINYLLFSLKKNWHVLYLVIIGLTFFFFPAYIVNRVIEYMVIILIINLFCLIRIIYKVNCSLM